VGDALFAERRGLLRPRGPRLGGLEAGRPGRPAPHAQRERHALPSTSVQLLPPKPKELVITRAGPRSVARSPGVTRCSGGGAGYRTPSPAGGGGAGAAGPSA